MGNAAVNIHQTENTHLVGEVGSVRFQDKESGWAILNIISSDGDFEASGIAPELYRGETVKLSGFFEQSPKECGKEFVFEHIIARPPESTEALQYYIADICEVGRGLVQDLITQFGTNIITVLDISPDKLYAACPNEAHSDIETMIANWKTRRGNVSAIAQVDEHGIPPSVLHAVQLRYSAPIQVDQLLANDPFELLVASDKVSYQRIRELADHYGIPHDSDTFVKGAVITLLRQRSENYGYTYIPEEKLRQGVSRILSGHRPTNEQWAKAKEDLALDVNFINKNAQLTRFTNSESKLSELVAETQKRIFTTDSMPAYFECSSIFESSPLEADLDLWVDNLELPLCCFKYKTFKHLSQGLSLVTELLTTNKMRVTVLTIGGSTANHLAEIIPAAVDIGEHAEIIGFNEAGFEEHGIHNTLDTDVIIITQADRFGVERLNRALSIADEQTRIVLFGADTQLPSVDAGDPFYTICQSVPTIDISIDWSPPESFDCEFDPTFEITALPCEKQDLHNVITALIHELEPHLKLHIGNVCVLTTAPTPDHLARKAVTEYFIEAELEPGYPFLPGEPACLKPSLPELNCSDLSKVTVLDRFGTVFGNENGEYRYQESDIPYSYPLIGERIHAGQRDLSYLTILIIPDPISLHPKSLVALTAWCKGPVILIGMIDELNIAERPLGYKSLLYRNLKPNGKEHAVNA